MGPALNPFRAVNDYIDRRVETMGDLDRLLVAAVLIRFAWGLGKMAFTLDQPPTYVGFHEGRLISIEEANWLLLRKSVSLP